MTAGNKTFLGLAVPLFGEATIEQQTAATDILTVKVATSQTGDYLVCADVDGDETFVVSSTGRIGTMVLGTVALASLASNASATVALSGLTTDCVVGIFSRSGATGTNFPNVWPSAADKLGYTASNAVTSTAATVNVWYFKTA